MPKQPAKFVFFTVFYSDLLTHFTHGLDYDVATLGIKVVLWCNSCLEDPVGTVPDDVRKWARWTGQDVSFIESRKGDITAGWNLTDDGRWEINRIMDQYDKCKAVSSERSKCGKLGAIAKANAKANAPANGQANRVANSKLSISKPISISKPKSTSTSSSTTRAIEEEDEEKNEDADLFGSAHSGKSKKPSKSTYKNSARNYGSRPDFCAAWKAYPRGDKKAKAFDAWCEMNPKLSDVLHAIAWKSQTDYWKRENGRAIPYMVTSLHDRFWDDEPPKHLGKASSEKSNIVRSMEELAKEAMEEIE